MGLYENMANEPVGELALREPVVVAPDDTIRGAVERMREARLGCVIVADEDNRPLGMFTESKLVQLISRNAAVVDEPVGDHKTEDWPWATLDDPILNVLEALESKNVRFVCVVDADGCVAGLTGQKGLMEYIADHFPSQVMVQRVGCTPYLVTREGA